MAIFSSYAPPGVYVQTLADQTSANITAGLRLPAIIGVGSENLTLTNYEVIRGSSSSSDIRIVGEDVSSQFDGTDRQLTVQHFPIVSGSGSGSTSNDPNTVLITVDDQPQAAVAVDGANGVITLGTIPPIGATVKVSYYFSRKDTKITGDDLSDQADGVSTVLYVNFPRIVLGNNGGISTTDPARVTVTVNGTAVAVTAVDGDSGAVTLASPPANGALVLATYFTNTYQDMFDYLPANIQINNVSAVGDTPNRQDYFTGTDYVIEAGNLIMWGSSVLVTKGAAATGLAFGNDQVSGILFDNRYYARQATGLTNGTNKSFTLEQFPTDGSGLGTVTNNVGLVQAYVGTTLQAALAAGPVVVTHVAGAVKTVTLKTAPAAGSKVYTTYYYNLLTDDSFTLTNTLASVGPTAGTFTVSSDNHGATVTGAFSLSDSLVAAPNFTTEGILFPNDLDDTQTLPGTSVAETVTLTFADAMSFAVSSSIGAAGSAGSGFVNQTYFDGKTGIRFTVLAPQTFSYQAGDTLVLNITGSWKTGSQPTRGIPGLRLITTDTTGVTVGSTAVVNTYNKSGNEPSVGDAYYVSLSYLKTNFDPKVYSDFKKVVADFGGLSVDNRLTLAANLAFLNGAPALALIQVLKNSGGLQANDADYIDAINGLENPLAGDVRPNFLVCLTTSFPVIQYGKKHCEKVSTERYGLERVQVYGYGVGTAPEDAQDFARALRSPRCIGMYPDGAVISLVDQFGTAVESVVDGSFLAAAFAGLACSPSFDVATPLTRKQLVGFTRLFRTLDAVSSNQSAAAGLTILTAQSAAMQVRQAVTTDPSNILTKEPTVTFISDYIQQQTRAVLDPFIAEKFLPNRLTDIEITLSNMLRGKIQAQIITGYTGVKATMDPNDPTQCNVVAFYAPVFPLNFIQVTYTIRTSL